MMSPTKPRTENLIVEHTIEVLDVHGEQAVRIQEIARSCNVSVSSIYHFFGDREGLLEAAHYQRYLNNQMDDVARYAGDFAMAQTPDDIKRAIDDLLAHLSAPERRAVRMSRINVIGSTLGRPRLTAKVTEAITTFNTVFAQALESLQERGLIRSDLEVHATAAWLIGLQSSRIFIEIGDQRMDEAAWDRLTRDAVHMALFAGMPEA